MKNLKVGAYLTGMALLGLGVAMAVTNPDQDVYDDYAAQQLTQYLKENVCAKSNAALQSPCDSLLKDNQAQIKKLISNHTERQNFLVLSVYKTDLSIGKLLPSFLGGLLPSYHFETVGAFRSFHIYEAKRQ
jgi:hypothetical protein